MNEKIQQSIFKLFILICLNIGLIHPTERIKSFHADITVHENGSMVVDETIVINAENKQIMHGIVREFPTLYRDLFGNKYFVDFVIQKIEHNGAPENYFQEKAPNGERIFIGDKKRYITPGEHVYRIVYITNFQLGFFETYDELYWNVTGNGWRFPIEKATARVQLPNNIPFQKIHAEGYVGVQGARGIPQQHIFNDGIIFFEAHNLNVYEGLTIVVTWPKGFIVEPTIVQKVIRFLKDNYSLLILLLGILLLLIYYCSVLFIVISNDKRGIIIPLYEPPHDLNPGAVRYISQMKYDTNVLVAEIINLAVYGFLKINAKKNEYTLIKTDKIATKNQDKYSLINSLFKKGNELVVDQKNQKIFGTLNQSLNEFLALHYKRVYFNYNTKYTVIGVVASFIFLIPGLYQQRSDLLFFGAAILGVMAILFGYFVKRYTQEGRKVKDAIDGFKMFLSATETDRLRILSSPEEALSEYEKYLPYAVALGVEENWTQQFAPIFELLTQQGKSYVPVWYVGKRFDVHHMGNFSHSIGSSFTQAISSASTAPGSKSGSGGRGSSGGGGGGGGGGGW